MKQYKVITANFDETLEHRLNEAAKEDFTLENVVTTLLVTGVHFTVIMSKNVPQNLKDRIQKEVQAMS